MRSKWIFLFIILHQIACTDTIDFSAYTIAEYGDSKNNYISEVTNEFGNFKLKFQEDPAYYAKNGLEGVSVFVFSMSRDGKDPLESLAGNEAMFKNSLQRNAFNANNAFGAITSVGDTLRPLLVNAPRTYGYDGAFNVLLSFDSNLTQEDLIRIYYNDNNLIPKPILFQIKN